VLPVVLKAMKKGNLKNLLSQVSVPGPSGPSCVCYFMLTHLSKETSLRKMLLCSGKLPSNIITTEIQEGVFVKKNCLTIST